jgi:hypothetical protein
MAGTYLGAAFVILLGGRSWTRFPAHTYWPRVFLFGATVILSETRNVLAGIVLAVAIAVILIDDFQVPHDPGYGFDAHDGVPLSLDYFGLPDGVVREFPATPSHEETGGRRGALYFAKGPSAHRAIRQMSDQGHLLIAYG